MNILRYTSIALLMCTCLFADAQTRNATYDAYINQYKSIAIEQMKIHKIPASITLAQGLLESGAGKSDLAVQGNNHFGIKCHSDWTGGRMYKDDDAKGECFRVYPTARGSYEDHSVFLERERYARLFTYDPLDYKAWAKGLKECGYATLSTYAERLINIIETYQLYRFDTDRSGSNRVDNTDSYVYYGETNTGSGTTGSNAGYGYTAYNHDHQPIIVNDLVCYRAVKEDNWDILAMELGVKKKKLLKYNECNDTYTQLEGMNVFICKKKSKAAIEYNDCWYRIGYGESMYSISQQFGVKVANLYKINYLSQDYVPAEGDFILIRKPSIWDKLFSARTKMKAGK